MTRWTPAETSAFDELLLRESGFSWLDLVLGGAPLPLTVEVTESGTAE